MYFSREGGLGQSYTSFIEPHNYLLRLQNPLRIVEFGLGFSLNLACLLRHLRQVRVDASLASIEYHVCDERVFPFDQYYGILADLGFTPHECFQCTKLLSEKSLSESSFVIKLFLSEGDVGEFLPKIPDSIDVWLLDGHSPQKNPAMWSEALFSTIMTQSKGFSTASSYASSGLVKEGLRRAGFFVKRYPGYGSKKHRIFGIKNSCQHSELRL